MRSLRIYLIFKDLLAISTITVLCVPVCGWATENDAGAWLVVSSSDAFGADDEPSRWRYTVDFQARYFDLGSGINQYLLRPGIGYSIGSNLSAWIGYARFRSRGRSGNVTDENRYWQQLAWSVGRYGGGTVTMRTRFEQRSVTAGDDVGLILRHLTRYSRPIGASGRTNLLLAVEPFVDLRDTDWGGDSGLGQVRTSLGISRMLNESLTVETAYMNQYVLADTGEDRSNHIALVHLRLSF